MIRTQIGTQTKAYGLRSYTQIVLSKRFYSKNVDSSASNEKKLSPEEARQQAAQLAMQSLKDVGSLLSSNPDSATQPIDTAPIWEDPSLFGSLSLLHQGQVTAELQAKYDKKWNKLTLKDKQLGYYIAYGNWGVREKFDNWKTSEPPYDLPFTVPSRIRTTDVSPKTPIKLLEPVILAETPVRKDQFDFKKMDGVTKFFIYLTAFIMMFAIYRDKTIGEAGKPVETVIEDPYEIERANRQLREEQERLEAEQLRQKELQKSNRKWYYLWLK